MSRYFTDRAAKRLVFILGLSAFLVLVLIAVFILKGSLPAFREIGFSLFDTKWYPSRDAFGILTMLVGSVVVTLLALAMAVPLALGCTIFLAEVAPPRLRELVRPAVELLVGIPSVVYGLVGMVVLCPLIADISGQGSGSSVLAAAIVLAIMVLPTVTSISEDSLRAVPLQYKGAALALGATRWQCL